MLSYHLNIPLPPPFPICLLPKFSSAFFCLGAFLSNSIYAWLRKSKRQAWGVVFLVLMFCLWYIWEQETLKRRVKWLSVRTVKTIIRRQAGVLKEWHSKWPSIILNVCSVLVALYGCGNQLIWSVYTFFTVHTFQEKWNGFQCYFLMMTDGKLKIIHECMNSLLFCSICKWIIGSLCDFC